jgi:hypothetical protein
VAHSHACVGGCKHAGPAGRQDPTLEQVEGTMKAGGRRPQLIMLATKMPMVVHSCAVHSTGVSAVSMPLLAYGWKASATYKTCKTLTKQHVPGRGC